MNCPLCVHIVHSALSDKPWCPGLVTGIRTSVHGPGPVLQLSKFYSEYLTDP